MNSSMEIMLDLVAQRLQAIKLEVAQLSEAVVECKRKINGGSQPRNELAESVMVPLVERDRLQRERPAIPTSEPRRRGGFKSPKTVIPHRPGEVERHLVKLYENDGRPRTPLEAYRELLSRIGFRANNKRAVYNALCRSEYFAQDHTGRWMKIWRENA